MNKTVGVLEHLQEVDCDICFIQETFFRDGNTAKIMEIKELGWNILSDPRKHRGGGGIAMLFRDVLQLKCNSKVTKYKSFQVMESLLQSQQDIVRLVNLYRPPYTKKARYTECAFLEEFEDYLKDLTVKPGFPIIAGDFNFHMEKPEEHYPKKLYQLLEEYDLYQHVPLEPTHDQGGTLDLVVTNRAFKEKLTSFEICPSRTKSDHFLVLFDADIKTKTKEDAKFMNYRNFNLIDTEQFKEDILISKLTNFPKDMTPNDAVVLYNTVLTQLMDKHCPYIKKKITKKPMPWLDLELRILRRKKKSCGTCLEKR